MRVRAAAVILVGMTASAAAETCSSRAQICEGACTPALVASGEQWGRTVAGCLSSCRERRASCLKTGIWVHMGAAQRGREQAVERR